MASPDLAMIEWETSLPEASAREAALCVAMFAAAGIAGVAAGGRGGSWNGATQLHSMTVSSIPRIALFFVLAGVAPFFVFGGSFQEIVAGIMASRGVEKPWVGTANLGDSRTPFLVLANSAMIGGAAVLAFCAVDTRRHRGVRFACAIPAIVGTAIVYVDNGTRSTFALIAVPVLAVIVQRQRARSRLRATITVLIAGVVLLAALQFQMLYRIDHTRADMASGFGLGLLTLGGTIDFFSETVFAITAVPAIHGYFHESVLLQFMVAPIPRFIWPGKPVPEIVWFHSLQRTGVDIYEQGGNVLPGVIGQQYMSWGLWGVVAGGFALGWLVRRIDRWFAGCLAKDVYLAGLYVMWVVWVGISFRFLAPGFLYPVLAAMGIVMAGRRRTPS